MKIYAKVADNPPPEDDHYYILAKNGSFLHKKNPLMKTILRVQEIPFLERQEEVTDFKYPSFSQEQTFQILSFFFWAYRKFHGESIVTIHYKPRQGYLLHAPPQEVCRETIHYSIQDRFPGYLLVGSIHSHGKFMACHSDGHKFSDKQDEINFDGMHITVGNINAHTFTISCSVMVNGRRFFLNPLRYLPGLKEVKIQKITLVWPKDTAGVQPTTTFFPPINQPVSQPIYSSFFSSYWEDDYWAPLSGSRHWEKSLAKENRALKRMISKKNGLESVIYLKHPLKPGIPFFFKLNLPEGQNIKNLTFPDEWQTRVTRFPWLERIKLGAERLFNDLVWGDETNA